MCLSVSVSVFKVLSIVCLCPLVLLSVVSSIVVDDRVRVFFKKCYRSLVEVLYPYKGKVLFFIF